VQAEGSSALLKACASCGLEKRARDFGNLRSSPDGLHFLCRACKAAFDSMRRGTPFHLGLSIDESQKRARVCRRCKEKKGAADFALSDGTRGTLQTTCRACASESHAIIKTTAQRVIPEEQICKLCRVVKPASDFHTTPHCSSGLKSVCRECDRKRSNEDRAVRTQGPEGHFLASSLKICSVCKEEKDRSLFYRSRLCVDGLTTKCKVCCKNSVEVYRIERRKTMLNE
jgi:hypothetical protein